MTNYLNGFTIISFNHKNKYVTLKAENYVFGENQNNIEESIINQSSDSEESKLSSKIYQFWIMEDNNVYKIYKSDEINTEIENMFARTIFK